MRTVRSGGRSAYAFLGTPELKPELSAPAWGIGLVKAGLTLLRLSDSDSMLCVLLVAVAILCQQDPML